jgi:antitoxin (DNA-binding transcriptional repressor) of toxin-antitoxin stability system
MRIESIQVERERLSEMVKGLPKGPVVITKKGRPCAALVSVEDGDLEPVLIAQDGGAWRPSMVARSVAACLSTLSWS